MGPSAAQVPLEPAVDLDRAKAPGEKKTLMPGAVGRGVARAWG
jgi:hypothetical protein